MSQSVKGPTRGFGSGHDLMAHEFKPCVGLCVDSAEPPWDSISLKINKLKKGGEEGRTVDFPAFYELHTDPSQETVVPNSKTSLLFKKEQFLLNIFLNL